MNEDQLKAIAKEYAEKTNVDFMDILYANRQAKQLLEWINKHYYLIDKDFIKGTVLVTIDRNPKDEYTRGWYDSKKCLLQSIFGPEVFNESVD